MKRETPFIPGEGAHGQLESGLETGAGLVVPNSMRHGEGNLQQTVESGFLSATRGAEFLHEPAVAFKVLCMAPIGDCESLSTHGVQFLALAGQIGRGSSMAIWPLSRERGLNSCR
jgi:hypothetical protein